VIDAAAEVTESVIGPETFVGKLTRVHQSLAFGNMLINWQTNSCTQVPDAFLLCPLGQPDLPSRKKGGILEGLAGAVAGIFRMRNESGTASVKIR
jgi:hypothetical protein